MTTASELECPLARGALPLFAAWVLRRSGWHVILAQPVPMKCVVVFAPHTSNWDFIIGLLAKWVIGIHFRFVAKDTLFATPLAPLFVRLGGIPVNRREHTGFIEQMGQAFRRHDDFRLVFAPEGTRSRTESWKSGFYHLTRAVGVPLALAFIDYSRRHVGVAAYMRLTGDVALDMARIAAFYADKQGRNPDQQGPVRLRE